MACLLLFASYDCCCACSGPLRWVGSTKYHGLEVGRAWARAQPGVENKGRVLQQSWLLTFLAHLDMAWEFLPGCCLFFLLPPAETLPLTFLSSSCHHCHLLILCTAWATPAGALLVQRCPRIVQGELQKAAPAPRSPPLSRSGALCRRHPCLMPASHVHTAHWVHWLARACPSQVEGITGGGKYFLWSTMALGSLALPHHCPYFIWLKRK